MSENRYMPQLDALRAFAVLLVIIAHWVSAESILNKYNANGICGVTLFFVLSGYLITGILLKSKESINNGGSVKAAFKTFYIRRTLRIFPLYYFVISIALIFNTSDIRDNFLWHFFYCSNFYFWKINGWQEHFAHFWSLSVEEQFYIFWPALILFISRRKLPIIFIIGVFIAVVYRIKTRSQWTDLPRFLTPGSLDSFCIGGLLAYGQLYKPMWFLIINRYKNQLAILFFLLYVSVTFWPKFNLSNFQFIGFFFTFISVGFVLLIHIASVGVKSGLLASILNNRVLIYVGKISYGLYIYHQFIPKLEGIQFYGWYSEYIVQLIRFIILLSVASLSWFLFEKPIVSLKRYFNFSIKEPSQEVKPALI